MKRVHGLGILLVATLFAAFLASDLGLLPEGASVVSLGLSGIGEDSPWLSLRPETPTRNEATAVNEPSPSYTPTLRKAAEEAARLDLLLIDGERFDPLLGPKKSAAADVLERVVLPSAALAELPTLSDTAYRLLQFKSPLGRAQNEAIKALGARVVAFIPTNAYIVAWPKAQKKAALQLADLRFEGELAPQVKLEASLRDKLLEPESGADTNILIQVAGFPGEDFGRYTAYLTALGVDEIVNRSQTGRPRLLLSLPQSAVAVVSAGLARLDGVEALRLFSLPVKSNYGSTWLLQSDDATLKTTSLFDAGITGFGQIYGTADSGLDVDACQFRYSADAGAVTLSNTTQPPQVNITNPTNKVMAYYVVSGSTAYDDGAGGFHGTGTTGCAVGDNYANLATQTDPGIDHSDGMAPAAKVVFQDVGSRTGALAGLMFADQSDLHTQAYASGVRVHNNSYGREDNFCGYDQDSQQIDQFSFEKPDYLIVFAAGNAGPKASTLGGEGSTAKNSLSVGACSPGWKDDGEDLISFSSRGPTTDGRIKPDLVTPGVIETATEDDGELVPNLKDVNGRPVYVSRCDNGNCAVALTGGTSFSAPTAAGMAILARQYFTDGFYPTGKRNAADGFAPSSALLRAVLLNSSHPLKGGIATYFGVFSVRGSVPPIPSPEQGFGRIALDDALYFEGDSRDLSLLADIKSGDATGPLSTGESKSYTIPVKTGMPLKITLAWIDPPSSTRAAVNLVNNLDLEVTAPDGTLYRGNVNMKNSVSQPALVSDPADALNPQEEVIVAQPMGGPWVVTVVAKAVPGAGTIGGVDTTRQGYALIATGDIGTTPDVLTARLGLQFGPLTGGCDNDKSLDKNEITSLPVIVTNRGEAASEAQDAQLEIVSEETTVPLNLLSLIGNGQVTVPAVAPHKSQTLSLQLSLNDTTADLCGKKVALRFSLKDKDGQATLTRQVTVPVGYDYAENGKAFCQTAQCNPPPIISRLERRQLNPGIAKISLTFVGSNLFENLKLSFGTDKITYERIELFSPNDGIIWGLTIADDAPLGPVTISASYPGGKEYAYENLLSIVAPNLPDGDQEGEQGEQEIQPPSPKGSSGGCTSGGSSVAGPLFALLALMGLCLRRQARSRADVMR